MKKHTHAASMLLALALTISGSAVKADPPEARFVTFAANHWYKGVDLYLTDGTSAGTRQLFNIFEGGVQVGQLITHSVDLGGSSVLLVSGIQGDTANRNGAYTLDADGKPQKVKTQRLSCARLYVHAVLDEKAYISCDDRLVVTDGTQSGTKDIAGAPGDRIIDVTSYGGKIIAFENGDRERLLTIDPDRRQASVLLELSREGAAAEPFGDTRGFSRTVESGAVAAIDKGIVFSRYTARTGLEPWVTDGTAAGTFRLANIAPRNASSINNNGVDFIATAGRVLFTAEGRIWTTDGTSEGTRALTTDEGRGIENYSLSAARRYGEHLVFVGIEQQGSTSVPIIVKSNGAPSGTSVVRPTYKKRSVSIQWLASFFFLIRGDEMYFGGNDAGENNLFAFNLATGVTRAALGRPKDGCTGPTAFRGPEIREMAFAGSSIVFSTSDRYGATGRPEYCRSGDVLNFEPWAMNIETMNMEKLSEINPGRTSSSEPHQLLSIR